MQSGLPPTEEDSPSKIEGSSSSPRVPPTNTNAALWITTTTLLFDSEWSITYAVHTEEASQILQSRDARGEGLLEFLSPLSHRIQGLDKKALIERIEPYMTQLGLWDQSAFKTFRIHIYANTEGGLCRVETRVSQPAETRSDRSPAPPASTTVVTDPSPSRAPNWIESLDEHWPTVAFVQNSNGGLTAASESIFQFTGRAPEEFLGDPDLLWKVIHEGDRDGIKNNPQHPPSLSQGSSRRFRIRHLSSGQIRYIMEYRRALPDGGSEGIWLDVSRETIAEKRLSSASWKETLGILTVGMAHDFSNILSGIISLSETFLFQLQEGNALETDAEVGMKLIQSNAKQATQLVQRIVRLHKGEAVERTYQDLNELVSEVSQLINKVLPRNIEVQLERQDEELPIYVDIVELRQVLINLALNAADAMPLGGWIRLTTRRLTTPPLFQQLVGTVPSSSIIALEIGDCGHGIAQKHLKTIFDPFFTTKYHNKGSGLGLYNSRRFIDKQGGAIGVNTKLNEGTTFSILMPEATFTEAEQEFQSEQMQQQVVIAGDNHSQVSATMGVLKEREFHVSTAQFEDDVLGQIEAAYQHQVGVILLADGPTANPLRLVPRIKKSFPKAKILLVISGCNPDELPTNITRQADRSIESDAPQSELIYALTELFRS